MRIEVTRSGLTEAVHPVAAAAVDASGRRIAAIGTDLEREFFGRSSFKPFQTLVSQRRGADLSHQQLAVASASHAGQPVHVAMVRRMLAEAGLEEAHLRCPPARPASTDADRLAARRSGAEPAAVFHNCSGKHAAMLRACTASGWSLDYPDLEHSLQREVIALVEEATARRSTPVGVDGCGVPTMRTDVTSLARAFSRVVRDAEFAPVADAMARLASLVGDGDRADAEMARWIPAVVKGGAAGCVAAGWLEGGVGFAAKAWTGDGTAAAVALLVLMERIGIVSSYQRERLAGVASPPVLGGGGRVGGYVFVE